MHNADIRGASRSSYVSSSVAQVQKNPVYKVDTSGAHAGIIVTYKAFGTDEVWGIDALRIVVIFKSKDKTFHCLGAFAQEFLSLED